MSDISSLSENTVFASDDRSVHERLLAESARFEGGMGALAWAILEMFRRGGMDDGALRHLQDQVFTYFARPTDRDCQDILRVVEERLENDRLARDDEWN